jgi:hypothetical protein
VCSKAAVPGRPPKGGTSRLLANVALCRVISGFTKLLDPAILSRGIIVVFVRIATGRLVVSNIAAAIALGERQRLSFVKTRSFPRSLPRDTICPDRENHNGGLHLTPTNDRMYPQPASISLQICPPFQVSQRF